MNFIFNDQTQSVLIDATKNGQIFTVNAFQICDFLNMLDPFSEIIISIEGTTKIIIPDDGNLDWMLAQGEYKLTFIDRNSKRFDIFVNVQGVPYYIDGAENYSENITSSVRIYITEYSEFYMFTIDGNPMNVTDYFSQDTDGTYIAQFSPKDEPYSILVIFFNNGNEYIIALSFA